MTSFDPFEASRRQIVDQYWPTPSAGFDDRLIAQMTLCAYLFVSSILFLSFHVIVLHKQGKRVWVWRLVETRYGRYIVPNMYTVTVLPSIIASGLIAGLLVNTRQVFIEGGSQRNSMLWRTVIWTVAYMQGWFAAFSGVTAALLISTEDKPFYLRPRSINTFYVVGPCVVLLGLLVPGVMCSRSWNYITERVQQAISLLEEASEKFASAGVLDADAIATGEDLRAQIQARARSFFSEYLAMLIFWTIASSFLLLISLVGWSLVLRLRRQQQSHEAPTRLPTPARASTMQLQHHGTGRSQSSWVSISDSVYGHGGESAGDLDTYKTSPSIGSKLRPLTAPATAHVTGPTLAYQPRRASDCSEATQGGAGDASSQRAMAKLIRDLTVTSFAVTSLASVFMADTILLSIKRHSMFQKWSTAEVGLTLTSWSYLIILSLCTTACLINEMFFLRGLSTAPTNSTTAVSTHAFGGRSGIKIETTQQIEFDSPVSWINSQELHELQDRSVRKIVPDSEQELDRKKSWRKPVPKIADLPTYDFASDDKV